jgi:NAD(P)H dehydrogenase (quinone)
MSTGKILITGATGDTGGYMIEQLLQKRPPAPGPRPPHRRPLEAAVEHKGLEVIAGDFLDLEAMRAAESC